MRNLFYSLCAFVATTAALPAAAMSPSNDGQYYELKRSYECQRDRRQYGRFYNYGYWQGGRWCGRQMPAGYYVYKDGVWYIWSAQRAPNDAPPASAQTESAAQVGER